MNKFIDAELKKLAAGLNIFTGPLAKTLMIMLSKVPPFSMEDRINEIMETVYRARTSLSSDKKEIIKKCILFIVGNTSFDEAYVLVTKILVNSLKMENFYDFTLIQR